MMHDMEILLLVALLRQHKNKSSLLPPLLEANRRHLAIINPRPDAQAPARDPTRCIQTSLQAAYHSPQPEPSLDVDCPMNPTPNNLANLLESLQHEAPASETDKPSPQEFTIDQLAFAAHTTVRNIRAYQDRGLLHPPQRRGRVGIYSEIHLARLRIISQLIERGYSLTTIGDLITAWESGRRLSDVLGLEVAVTTAWSKETPVGITLEQLMTDFQGLITQQDIQRIMTLGYVEIDGLQIRILKPRIYNAAKELVAAGIPMADLIEHVSMIRSDIERLAERFVDMALYHLIDKKYSTDGLPDGEGVATLARFIKRTPALADMIVDTEIERLLDMTVNNALVERLEKVLQAKSASTQAEAKPVSDKTGK